MWRSEAAAEDRGVHPWNRNLCPNGAVVAGWFATGIVFALIERPEAFDLGFALAMGLPVVFLVWAAVGAWILATSVMRARELHAWGPVLACVGLFGATALGMFAISLPPARLHPTDEQMIREFRERRAEYDRLLALYRADTQLGRIAPDFTRPANFFSGDTLTPGEPPSARQVDEIRKQCRRLHLRAGIEGYDGKDHVEFIRSTYGLSISGSAKGFLWTTERPQLVVEDTDRYTPPEPKSYVVCRPIEGNWYVFYDCTY